jgi:hypothetical protein
VFEYYYHKNSLLLYFCLIAISIPLNYNA